MRIYSHQRRYNRKASASFIINAIKWIIARLVNGLVRKTRSRSTERTLKNFDEKIRPYMGNIYRRFRRRVRAERA